MVEKPYYLCREYLTLLVSPIMGIAEEIMHGIKAKETTNKG